MLKIHFLLTAGQVGPTISISAIILLGIILVSFFFLLYLPLKILKIEKEGIKKITDAAKDLNNRSLHEAALELSKANKLKYSIFYLLVSLSVISIAFSILSSKM